MNQQTVKSVLAHAKKGHTVMLRRSHLGSPKIKVKYGPFGLLTSRYSTDIETFEEIKKNLNSRHD